MRPTFDNHDQDILTERLAARQKLSGPRVGDFVETAAGPIRIAYVWPENRIQLAMGGSFYLCDNGEMSYSGGLEPAETMDLIPSQWEEPITNGVCWFFHHDHATAHNGIDVIIPVRIWQARPKLAHQRTCRFCGTADIQERVSAWVNVNTNALELDPDSSTGEFWCNDCEAHISRHDIVEPSSADIGRHNRALMFGENDEAFPDADTWSRIVD